MSNQYAHIFTCIAQNDTKSQLTHIQIQALETNVQAVQYSVYFIHLTLFSDFNRVFYMVYFWALIFISEFSFFGLYNGQLIKT